MEYNLIVACQADLGIGLNNTIPWNIPEDLQHFKNVTCNVPNNNSGLKNVVIMGRKTWDSIPIKHRPLKGRINIVISKNLSNDIYPIESNEIKCFNELEAVDNYLKRLQFDKELGKIFIIGGQSCYEYYLKNVVFTKIYLTRVFTNTICDVKMPMLNRYTNYYSLSKCGEVLTSKNGVQYQFREYTPYIHSKWISESNGYFIQDQINKPNIGEYQYLNLINNIIKNGSKREDRTGIGTRSIFGTQMRFDLSESFPLLTTKRMFLRGIIEELLWFIRGETDAKILAEKKVRIWEGNSSREYLDSIGLVNNREGDCGPIYGHNFRYYGAKYVNCETDYAEQGYDQVKEALRLIREEPTSRRILINLWNPCDLDKVALPPCHVLYQFYVEGDYLSCSMYQRSGDVGLGVPFNIASASLMTYIFAKLTGKKPKELIHTIGDAHLYENHLEAIQKQLNRIPYGFPILQIKDRGQMTVEDFIYEDFDLTGYDHHTGIKMTMAV